MSTVSYFKAQRDELSASEILQIEQRGIDSIVDRFVEVMI